MAAAMHMGRVLGTVVATIKDGKLEGKPLLLVQGLNLQGMPTGKIRIAVDTLGSRSGDTVWWVHSREAAWACAPKGAPTHSLAPVDVAIVGRVDDVDFSGCPKTLMPNAPDTSGWMG